MPTPLAIDHPVNSLYLWNFDDSYHCNKPIYCGRALVKGGGYFGTDLDGPILNFRGEVDGIVMGDPGGGTDYHYTGSLLERFKLTKSLNGIGTAITAVASSNAVRPGRIIMRDLLICAHGDLGSEGSYNWDRGIYIDGGNLNATNAAGVREVLLQNVRTVGCQAKHLDFRNVVHGRFYGLQCDTASGLSVPKLLFKGCQNLYFDGGCEVFGDVEFINCKEVQWEGFCQRLTATGCEALRVEGRVQKGMNIQACTGYTRAYMSGNKPVISMSSKFQVQAT